MFFKFQFSNFTLCNGETSCSDKTFTCGMPSSSIWHVMMLRLTIATRGTYYYDPHFTGEETQLHKRISSFPKVRGY